MKIQLIQTRALFIDAYRELSSKKLFWLALAISLLVVGVLASFGVSPKGVTLLWWEFENSIFNSKLISPGQYYKFVFSEFGVPYWLGWGATILALVSTGGLFPDFIASGSIELMHLGGYNTLDALPGILAALREAGLTPATLSEMVR